MIDLNLSCERGSLTFSDLADNRSPLRVWYAAPSNLTADSPIVFVMHGTKRDAEAYRDVWARAASRFGFLLLCPEFDAHSYSGRAYHLGNLVDHDGQWRTRSSWSFTLIERLFDRVKALTGNSSSHYGIYGHSAGGQFVHRMVLFLPQARARISIAANAGWYTMPTFASSRFPYSLHQTSLGPEALVRSFDRHLLILLGEHDTNPNDSRLRQSGRAQEQGAHRFARGIAFYRQAYLQATQLQVPLRWELQTVVGAAHEDLQMMPTAAAALAAALAPAARSVGERQWR